MFVKCSSLKNKKLYCKNDYYHHHHHHHYHYITINISQVIITSLYGTNLNVSVEVNNQFLDYFDVSGEWELKGVAVNISSVNNDTVQFVVLDLTLQRRFYFYLLTVLFPMVVLSVTGACGFLLPLQCGEKVSFQVRGGGGAEREGGREGERERERERERENNINNKWLLRAPNPQRS